MQTHVTVSELKIDGDRLRADFEALAQMGETEAGGISRLALSPEDLIARAWLADRIEDAGLTLHDDDAGNLSGILPAADPDAKILMVGSHLDSVPDGGRFDGVVGVLAGLECARTIKEAGLRLPCHLEVIDFTDDEGTWQSLFGSRAIAGRLKPADINDSRTDNAPFRAAMMRAGIEPTQVFRARRDMDTLMGYLELHIEQGSRLERAGVNIGVVKGIVGRSTFEVRFHGQAGHSGTSDMYKRRDALRGAALFITRAHDVVRERYGDGIFNCGNIDVYPGAYNIIPSLARLIVEVRHVSETILADMETEILSLAREAAARHGLTVDIERSVHMPAAPMSEAMMAAIERSCTRLNLSHTRLVSYSGHDGQMLADLIPCGMIFIPSVGGMGHHPNEYTDWGDVVSGANVLLQTILDVASAQG